MARDAMDEENVEGKNKESEQYSRKSNKRKKDILKEGKTVWQRIEAFKEKIALDKELEL